MLPGKKEGQVPKIIGIHYNHKQIRNAVAVFGSLFNNIVIKRADGKFVPVPIAYGPRDKWLEAQKAFKKEEEMFEKILPRMSYELVAMNYDAERKLTNSQTMIRKPDILGVPRQRVPVPVPYNLDFTLYVQTKNLNDGWQIIEQILPFFTPAYTVKVRHFPADLDSETPAPTNTFDMPITLSSVNWADDWTGDIGDRRIVEWNIEFSAKIHLFGPVAPTTVILDSRAVVAPVPGNRDVSKMNRGNTTLASEVGYANIKDSEISWDSDSVLSPSILNLQDSEGNIVKIVRSINIE